MNYNPNAKSVLCFGDSNTWGQKPDKSGRYAADVRWTGVLQKLLGDKYYVIEEGLSSRTTDLEYDKKAGRNGRTYLWPCIESHNPIDIVLIMLGTNDFKTVYGRTAPDVANALKGLVGDVKQLAKDKEGNTPEIILISPILIDSNAPRFLEFYSDSYDERSGRESKLLAAEIEKVAAESNSMFLDASTVAKPGEDGIHFDELSERQLGELIASTVSTL